MQLDNRVINNPWGKEIIEMEIEIYFKLDYYEIKLIKTYAMKLKLFLEENI